MGDQPATPSNIDAGWRGQVARAQRHYEANPYMWWAYGAWFVLMTAGWSYSYLGLRRAERKLVEAHHTFVERTQGMASRPGRLRFSAGAQKDAVQEQLAREKEQFPSVQLPDQTKPPTQP